MGTPVLASPAQESLPAETMTRAPRRSFKNMTFLSNLRLRSCCCCSCHQGEPTPDTTTMAQAAAAMIVTTSCDRRLVCTCLLAELLQQHQQTCPGPQNAGPAPPLLLHVPQLWLPALHAAEPAPVPQLPAPHQGPTSGTPHQGPHIRPASELSSVWQ